MSARRYLAPVLILIAAAAVACGGPVVSDITGSDGSRTPLPGTPTPSAGHHHPDGWADPMTHGLAAKFQQEDCRGCHAADLTGGTWNNGTADVATPSCDSCHTANWRTTCTFCHGGTDNALGAPPRDITGETQKSKLIFHAHTAHVTASADHVAYDCVQCHVKPTNALDATHWFDTTPGIPEVTFTAGLSATGTFGASGSGQCMTNYCHSNGRGNTGTVNHDDTMTCHSCHPYLDTPATWTNMSGQHRRHLNMSGVTCHDCHGATVNAANAVATAANHVDGKRETMFTTAGNTIVFNAATRRCTGSCHGQGHSDGW